MAAQQEFPIVLEGGKLVDGTGNPPVENATVLIEGNRFKAVSRKGQLSYPKNTKVIKTEGKTLLPGLWDTHVHYRDWMAELFLAHGVTTILDLGNPSTWIMAQRDGVAKGKIRAPRIFACGDPIGEGHGKRGDVKDVGQAHALVQRLLSEGVDAVKVWAHCTAEMLKVVAEEAHAAGRKVIGHLGVITARDAVLNGLDCLAHATGLPMSAVKDSEKAQWMLNQEIRRLQTMIIGEPGITAWGLFAMMEEDTFDQVAEFLVSRRIRIEPDFVYRWQLASRRREEREYEDFIVFSDPRLSYIPPVTLTRNMRAWQVYRRLNEQQLTELKEGYDKFQKFLHRFVRAGGEVDIGTDTSEGRMPGKGVHREFEFLVDAGFSPRDIIVWATKGSAEFIGKGDELGTVEAGKIADVIVVNGDPLADIRALGKIETVIKNGEIVDIAYHPDYSNPIPRPYEPSLHSYPVPKIVRVSPVMAVEGSGPVTLAIEGEGFVRGSVVQFGGVRVPTNCVSGKELQAQIPAHLLARVGTYTILVANPGPVAIKDPLHEDERSNPQYFMVGFS
ncbi:MAG: hypothetical protein A3F90_02435 [Deltaproteobacteria bacterium RIFCSPLOWO2_12_FULL_60_19]|nr:MAG: hypothetical protein A3F90_02435 [Deltaproteobacteria bacterium RIFCSPLOWO2_12_FULL_60_19]